MKTITMNYLVARCSYEGPRSYWSSYRTEIQEEEHLIQFLVQKINS